MRTVLLGTDLVYDGNGNLVPIEINTNVGLDSNRIEFNSESIFNLTELDQFVQSNNFTEVYYIGSINDLHLLFQNHWTGSTINYSYIETEDRGITVPFVEDAENRLIIRSAYDSTALVDEEYCANKINFLNLIKNESFGSEVAYKSDTAEIINNITFISDNGIHPNFILKSSLPSYDKVQYPKLFKFDSLDDVTNFLQTIPDGYYLTHYYFNASKSFENHCVVYRSLNILYPPSLQSISIGGYRKITNISLDENITYNETTKELLNEHNEKYITKNSMFLNPKLADGDMVQMADGSFKTVEQLQVGDLIKTISIPNLNNEDIKNQQVNFRINMEEFISGTTFSTNEVTSKKRINQIGNIVKLNFTDGTDWYDLEYSPYLVSRDNEIRFITINSLQSGDIVILVSESEEQFTSTQKTIQSIEFERRIFNGWTIGVANEYLFLTKTSQEGSNDSFVAIEHNTSCNCSPCSTCGKQCQGLQQVCWYGQCFYVGSVPC